MISETVNDDAKKQYGLNRKFTYMRMIAHFMMRRWLAHWDILTLLFFMGNGQQRLLHGYIDQ